MKKIRIVTIDDSSMVHILIEKVVASLEDIEIVGEAYDGNQGIELVARLAPDVIVLDIGMPEMGGLDVIKVVMEKKPTPIIVFSAVDKNQVGTGFKALELGAVDIVEKPRSGDLHEFKTKLEGTLFKAIRNFADFKVIRRLQQAEPVQPGRAHTFIGEKPQAANNITQKRKFPVIVIAASTGGPQTVRTLVEDFSPGKPDAGIVIAQHIGEGFIDGFCGWLQEFTALPVIQPADNGELKAGHIYIAPSGYHLTFHGNERFAYLDAPPVFGIRPAADILLSSAAAVFKSRLIAVILTGMGADGTLGIKDVRSNGGTVIAQDEQSSILFGMPKAAIESGNVDVVAGIGKIGELLENYCSAWHRQEGLQ